MIAAEPAVAADVVLADARNHAAERQGRWAARVAQREVGSTMTIPARAPMDRRGAGASGGPAFPRKRRSDSDTGGGAATANPAGNGDGQFPSELWRGRDSLGVRYSGLKQVRSACRKT
jgi:hypothetical protein